MSQQIGITEQGDAGIHFEWLDEIDLMGFAVLITKEVNDRFIKEVLKYKDKVIIHACVTGMGGSVYEPNVPTVEWSHSQILKLIESGFPVSQIVLRVDPIIPTSEGLANVSKVLYTFKDTGIKRCKVSVIDMYPHVKGRFKEANVPIPFDGFTAERGQMDYVIKTLELFRNDYSFETCAENLISSWRCGCISQKDANILNKEILFYGKKNQRPGCLCPMNKHEMLSHPQQCAHKCLYCYWK